MPDPSASGALVGSLGLFAGYLALVIWLVWDVGHRCHDDRCERNKRRRDP